MVVYCVAVIDVEFPRRTNPSIKVHLKFGKRGLIDVVFIESIKSMMRFKLQFPKWIEADE